MLAGGGLGNAVLFSIGQALPRAPARKVLYFAGYKKMIDRYKVEEIEAAADVVVWCCDEAPGFTPGRPQDKAVRRQHRRGDAARTRRASWASSRSRFSDADRIIAIGSDGMMDAVRLARHGVLQALPQARPPRASARSTRPCNA